jgi:Gpi16 subunit, GPI transamidase component
MVTCGNHSFYSSGALLDLPQPDFSMPFNVITLTCTLVAFFVGTAINVLIRKSEWKGEGGKHTNDSDSDKKKTADATLLSKVKQRLQSLSKTVMRRWRTDKSTTKLKEQ